MAGARRLLELWNSLAVRLGDQAATDPTAARRLDWLRQSIIAPFKPSSAPPALTWVNQALALAAWRSEAQTAGPAQPSYRTLTQRCDELRERVAELKASRGGLFGRKPSSDLATDLDDFLQECRRVFATLAKTQPEPLEGAGDLEHQIDATIHQLPPSWPPLLLVTFQDQLIKQNADQFRDLLPRTLKRLALKHAKWRNDLAKATADWSSDGREAVLLVRALLNELTEVQAAPEAWSELAVLLRELLTPHGLHGELIRDPKHPRHWFEPPTEADVAEPIVKRIGLALRKPPGGWIGFPKGKLIVPIPLAVSPWREAADGLTRLIAEHDWLAPMASAIEKLAQIDPETSTDCQDLIRELLTTLTDLTTGTAIPAEGTRVLEQVLSLTRQWCDVTGIAILPRCWHYDRRCTADQLSDDEAERSIIFHPSPLGDIIDVSRLGLARGHETIRLAAVTISAGVAPDGFDGLLSLLTDAADGIEAEIRARLDGWAGAALSGTLDVVVVQFYVDFWDRYWSEWRNHDPGTVSVFTEHLYFLMQHALQLFPFQPQAYQDYPDGWLQRVGGRGMVTGRVRRVLRPGLQDGQNQLRLPALVEVE